MLEPYIGSVGLCVQVGAGLCGPQEAVIYERPRGAHSTGSIRVGIACRKLGLVVPGLSILEPYVYIGSVRLCVRVCGMGYKGLIRLYSPSPRGRHITARAFDRLSSHRLSFRIFATDGPVA